MNTAVHFGAGNIGRGFIGLLLHRAGYEVVFADVIESLVKRINQDMSYKVMILDEVVEEEMVDHVRAVQLDSQRCKDEIVRASLVTTAVGLGNLAPVGAILADALRLRREQNPDQTLNILACENAIRATSTLKEEILKHADKDLKTWIETMVGFADVAVDRIAPNRARYATGDLDAVVERFFEWDIETANLKGELQIPGASFVDALDPFLERKLFILNGAHAAAAYAGYQKKYNTILEALADRDVAALVTKVQQEAMLGLYHQYSSFAEGSLESYAESVRSRFTNPHIHDDVARVGRDPMRKLSQQDRLVGALKLAQRAGIKTPGLVHAIALGLLYDQQDDPSALQVQQLIQEDGVKQAITKITGITDSAVIEEIAEAYTLSARQVI